MFHDFGLLNYAELHHFMTPVDRPTNYCCLKSLWMWKSTRITWICGLSMIMACHGIFPMGTVRKCTGHAPEMVNRFREDVWHFWGSWIANRCKTHSSSKLPSVSRSQPALRFSTGTQGVPRWLLHCFQDEKAFAERQKKEWHKPKERLADDLDVIFPEIH